MEEEEEEEEEEDAELVEASSLLPSFAINSKDIRSLMSLIKEGSV